MYTEPVTMTSSDLKGIIETEFIHNTLTQTALLQHWLNIPGGEIAFESEEASDLLRSAIIIGLDAEWYEHDASYITELGVSILDPDCVPTSTSASSSTAWDILATLENHHIRINENAHLINRDLCENHPDSFQFGSTTFAGIAEARDMLQEVFTRRDSDGGLRPVIFLGYAMENDSQIIKDRFGIDIEALGSVVTTLDTQMLAVEHNLTTSGRKIRLAHLLGQFNISEPYLYNAGNDIVATLVAALLMVCTPSEVAPQLAYADLKSQLTATNAATLHHRTHYGQSRFCVRSGSGQHMEKYCKVAVFCEFCALEGESAEMHRHTGERCRELVKAAALGKVRGEIRNGWMGKGSVGSGSENGGGKGMGGGRNTGHACPCQNCIESSDHRRFGGSVAYGHLSEECPWGTIAVQKTGK